MLTLIRKSSPDQIPGSVMACASSKIRFLTPRELAFITPGNMQKQTDHLLIFERIK